MTEKAMNLSEEDAMRLGAHPDVATRHVAGIVNGLRAATAIPELRDLVVRYLDPDEHRRRVSAAVSKLREYLRSVSKPDPEAIIRRALIALGYEGRKAHSLFESLDVAEKRRAAKSSDK